MATIDELRKAGRLAKISGNLTPDELPDRFLFANPAVIHWFRTTLQELLSDNYFKGARSPKEQVFTQIREYVRGDEYENWMTPKLLRPHESAVWELKTHDLRFFGWFYRRKVFVLNEVDTKTNCKPAGAVDAKIASCISFRESLGLDPPPFIEGDLSDVF